MGEVLRGQSGQQDRVLGEWGGVGKDIASSLLTKLVRVCQGIFLGKGKRSMGAEAGGLAQRGEGDVRGGGLWNGL